MGRNANFPPHRPRRSRARHRLKRRRGCVQLATPDRDQAKAAHDLIRAYFAVNLRVSQRFRPELLLVAVALGLRPTDPSSSLVRKVGWLSWRGARPRRLLPPCAASGGWAAWKASLQFDADAIE